VAFFYPLAADLGFVDKGAASALNLLLKREAWARGKLAPFAGEVVELRAPPLPGVRFTIRATGYVDEPAAGSEPTLTLTAKPEIFAALSKGEEHLMRAVDISGNASLASEILALVRYLRWDIEEDLSRVFGDVIAHRMVGTARQLAAWQAEAGRRLAENLMEYAIEERRVVVGRAEFDLFAADVSRLRDDLARLEQRIERHQQRGA
jgi:ubiquinone biosynthesis accessory factor UbiJ